MSDTTKTPRTDALLETANDSDVFVELARQLERELACMKSSNDAMLQRLAPSVEYVEGTAVGYGEDAIDRLERQLAHSASTWKAAMEEREWWENKAKSYKKLLPHSFEEH